MSAGDHVMDSEKEEVTTTNTNLEEHHDEQIPGSSPEGVFQNEAAPVFEPIEQEHRLATHHIPLRLEDLKHGEEIVEQETEVIDQGDIIVDEGQQYMFQNMVQISQEDMYEAGFEMDDLNHLSEEQLNIVISISQQRQAKQNDQNQEANTAHHHMIHHGVVNNHYDGEESGGHVNEYEAEDGRPTIPDNSVHIILTNDGGVSITDTKQHQYYIPPDVIANLNIDLNALSTEHVNQLLQLAIPSMKEGAEEKNEDIVYNGDRLNQEPSTSYQQQHNNAPTEKTSRNPIIGETVQIRTADGRLQDAVVKYFRGNSEFKIQFMDGEFAYATLDQMQVNQRSRGDHDNYQVASPMLIRRTDVAQLTAQKRAAMSNEDICPPALKRSYHLAPTVDGPHNAVPNFCCPICDKKVFQKEPSYIVIRLPACDSCTREKIIVLDESSN